MVQKLTLKRRLRLPPSTITIYNTLTTVAGDTKMLMVYDKGSWWCPGSTFSIQHSTTLCILINGRYTDRWHFIVRPRSLKFDIHSIYTNIIWFIIKSSLVTHAILDTHIILNTLSIRGWFLLIILNLWCQWRHPFELWHWFGLMCGRQLVSRWFMSIWWATCATTYSTGPAIRGGAAVHQWIWDLCGYM